MVLGFCILSSAFCISADWPQWRGPQSSGVSPEHGVALEWGAAENIAWKTPIPGRGHSSPIISGNRIFLTTAIEGEVLPGAKAAIHYMDEKHEKTFVHPDSMGADHKQTFKVLCLDAASGKILWEQTAYDGAVYDNRHKRSSFASPTPVTDGRTVFAFFGSEGVYAYDFSGKQLWKANIGRIPNMGLGTGTSPVLHQNLLILQADEDTGAGSFILALDKRTGKEVWKTPRKVQVSWSTPVIVQSAGRTELVASGNELVIGYDPATGKELWRTKGVQSNAIASPVFAGDLVFVSAGFPKKTLAIRLGGSGELTPDSGIVWTYEKGTAYVASNLLYDGFLYLITDKGILSCLDAKTGEVKYDSGRPPGAATFTASPIAVDGKILITSEDGETYVIQPGPKFEVLRTNSLGEPVYSSPAVSGGSIYIRGEKNLYRITGRKS